MEDSRMHIKCWGNTAPAYAPAPASEAAEITYKEQESSDVHKVRCDAAEIMSKEQQDFHVEYDGDYMIQIHSKICQGTRNHFGKLLNEYGMSDLIPVYLEKDALNFYFNREVKSEEIHSLNDAEQCLEKENQQSGKEYGRAVSS